MPAPLQQNFIMQPPKDPVAMPSMQQGGMTQIPAEAYLTYMKVIDPEGIYLNKYSRLLYNSYLVRSDVFDETSPIPGYKRMQIGGPGKKTLVNWDGYSTITNNFIILVSEAVSTTEFDLKEINLKRICIDGVWSIIVQLVTNWEDWEFDDPAEIMPLGIGMWLNVYSITRRSTGGGKMLHFLTGLFKFLGPHRPRDEENPQAIKFWRSNGST